MKTYIEKLPDLLADARRDAKRQVGTVKRAYDGLTKMASLADQHAELLKALRELNQAIVAHIEPGTMLTDKRLCKAHLAALKAMGPAWAE